MVRIRLRRVGKKKQPSYRVVVADSRSPRDGRFIEAIGFYNPRTDPPTFCIDEARALYWLLKGAQPSEPVARLLEKQGTLRRFARLKDGEDLESVLAEAQEHRAAEQKATETAEAWPERPREAMEDWRSFILTDDDGDVTEQLICRDGVPQRVESIAYELLARRGCAPPGEILEQIKGLLLPRLRQQLQESGRFIAFGNEWFLANLLRPVAPTELDQAEKRLRQRGEPSPLSGIFPAISETDIALVFSWNYCLDHDNRFDNVGTFDTPLWFLRALEPPEVVEKPGRLAIPAVPYTREYQYVHRELKDMEQAIDDEGSEAEEQRIPPVETRRVPSVEFVLNFAHRVTGTIPLTQRIRQVFPRSNSERTYISFIDARSRERIPSWVMHKDKYAWGLKEWYESNLIWAGAYVRLETTENPLDIVVDCIPLAQPKEEQVRVAHVIDRRLTFEWQTRIVPYKYDPLMLIAETRFEDLEALRLEAEKVGKPIFEVMHDVFPELARLHPQGHVHAKTLYQAVNLVRRCAPGTVFGQLSVHLCFDPVGGGYWTYDPDLRDMKVVYKTQDEVDRRDKWGKIIKRLDERLPSLHQRVDSLKTEAEEQAGRLESFRAFR
ncbi:MAG: 30S ribosomal protein S16 [Chloroflexota bacterium]